MVGKASYSRKQIEFVLIHILDKAPLESIAEAYHETFGQSVTVGQLKYLKGKYGKDPDYGSPLLEGRVRIIEETATMHTATQPTQADVPGGSSTLNQDFSPQQAEDLSFILALSSEPNLLVAQGTPSTSPTHELDSLARLATSSLSTLEPEGILPPSEVSSLQRNAAVTLYQPPQTAQPLVDAETSTLPANCTKTLALPTVQSSLGSCQGYAPLESSTSLIPTENDDPNSRYMTVLEQLETKDLAYYHPPATQPEQSAEALANLERVQRDNTCAQQPQYAPPIVPGMLQQGAPVGRGYNQHSIPYQGLTYGPTQQNRPHPALSPYTYSFEPMGQSSFGPLNPVEPFPPNVRPWGQQLSLCTPSQQSFDGLWIPDAHGQDQFPYYGGNPVAYPRLPPPSNVQPNIKGGFVQGYVARQGQCLPVQGGLRFPPQPVPLMVDPWIDSQPAANSQLEVPTSIQNSQIPPQQPYPAPLTLDCNETASHFDAAGYSNGITEVAQTPQPTNRTLPVEESQANDNIAQTTSPVGEATAVKTPQEPLTNKYSDHPSEYIADALVMTTPHPNRENLETTNGNWGFFDEAMAFAHLETDPQVESACLEDADALLVAAFAKADETGAYKG